MEPVEILVTECRGVAREHYVVEQGIPVLPIAPAEARRLTVSDKNGAPVAASVEPEGFDQHGAVRWVLVSIPVDLPAGGQTRFSLREGPAPADEGLRVSREDDRKIVVANRFFKAEFTSPGEIRLTTHKGLLIEGAVGFDIRSDARSAVGNLRPVLYEPRGYEVLQQTDRRIKLILRGSYRAWAPKAFDIDPERRFDADVEFVIHAGSPVIRLRWRITNLMRFNCPYMWLDRYVLSFPLAEGSAEARGEDPQSSGNLGRWASVECPGGRLACAFPFADWLGKGAGVEVKDGRIGHGGIDPPPDGGFGGEFPHIWRKFYYGMSRSFEAALLVNPEGDQIAAELNPIPLILSPQHYSDTGALPENGSDVTFGGWKAQIDRAAEHLIETQWRGTLWFGEWWRERDVDHDLGVEETNSGNSALAPLHHFYRTGDWRFWESAKMSYYYTYDIQFCKQTDGYGPYMHTRRFLLDHQEWFHPRYQRVAGIIEPSHLLGDGVARDKTIWLLRHWAENYVAEDGSPMTPNPDGTKSKCGESAMSNLIDALIYGYVETGEELFLDRARRMGDWVVRRTANDLDALAENSNSTRYILRGLLALCRATGDQCYKDAFVELARWTVNAPTFEYGTHYVAFHFHFASEAYKMSPESFRGDILDGISKLAEWVLSKESPDSPGTYPFPQRNQYPPARWICIYDNQAIVSYLPVLASTLAEAGMPPL